MLEDYGFDGIHIDYEFPDTNARGAGLASLVTELRSALNDLQKKKGDATPYLVTVRPFPLELEVAQCSADVTPGRYQRSPEPIQVLRLQEDGCGAQLLEPHG